MMYDAWHVFELYMYRRGYQFSHDVKLSFCYTELDRNLCSLVGFSLIVNIVHKQGLEFWLKPS